MRPLRDCQNKVIHTRVGTILSVKVIFKRLYPTWLKSNIKNFE